MVSIAVDLGQKDSIILGILGTPRAYIVIKAGIPQMSMLFHALKSRDTIVSLELFMLFRFLHFFESSLRCS